MAWAYEVGRLVERPPQEAQTPAAASAAAAALPPAGDAAVTSRHAQGQGHGEEKETRRVHTYGKVRDAAMNGRGGCRYRLERVVMPLPAWCLYLPLDLV